MEFPLIFKRKNMKKVINIIFIVAFIIANYSCEDSLGYDPNVTINEIIKDTTDVSPSDTAKQTVFKVDSINSYFKEYVKFGYGHKEYNWFGKTVKKSIRLDTSNNKTILWLDWHVESLLNDNDYRGTGRIDRVNRFELQFEAILDSRTYELNLDKQLKRKLIVEFVRMKSGPTLRVEPSQYHAQFFVVRNDRKEGILTMMFVVDIKPGIPLQVKRFDGLIHIHYK